VLALLSFIIISALKMENNQEMKQYHQEKEAKAKQELTILNEANGQAGI
jgi:Tfp pilus assembly protein PilP